jgi:TRAP-type uncharacterized transport system substrate-binding protein
MSVLIRNLPWVIFGTAFAFLAAIILQIVTSMPPKSFTILTGSEDGGYYLAAREYQRVAREKGFDIQIRTTNGASETLQLLEAGAAEVGFVQSGIARLGDPNLLSTIANVFYEPVWIFYRDDSFASAPLNRLPQAIGKRVNIGPEGSGTRELFSSLAARAGMTAQNTTFLDLPFGAAAQQLIDGNIDVAVFVVADSSELPWQLLRTPGISLMSVARAGAYAFYYPWLTELSLPEGGADVERNIPPEPKQLLATTANLVARNDMHPDLVRLLTIAAIETHRNGGKFEKPGQFPNVTLTDLPVDPEAEAYMQQLLSGRSYLDRYFPFWLASTIDRYLLFVVPALLIILPFLSRSPQAFQWYMRQRVVRWYKIVHDIERRSQTMDLAEIEAELRHLELLDERIGDELVVTNTFMPQVYELRQHMAFVVEKLQKRKQALLDKEAVRSAGADTVPAAAPAMAPAAVGAVENVTP